VLSASATAVTSSYSVADATTVSYYSVQSSASGSSSTTSLTSAVFSHYYLAAAVACKGWTAGNAAASVGCQVLANLCALQLSSPAAKVCMLVADLVAARTAVNGWSGWTASLPLLKWGTSASSVVADTGLSSTYYFSSPPSGSYSALSFYVASYALNGTFLGVSVLNNQLSYCSAGAGASPPSWLSYGTSKTVVSTCDMRVMITAGMRVGAASTLSYSLVEPTFYSLFVNDHTVSGTSYSDTAAALAASLGSVTPQPLPLSLFPIPVRITNYRDATGSTPNANSNYAAESDDVFTGLFTLFDAVSSITTAGSTPTIVRYASTVMLTILTQSSDSRKILPPVLTITYKERLVSNVLSDPSMGTDSMTLKVEYGRSTYFSFGQAIIGLGVTLAVVVLLVSFASVSGYLRLNARTPYESVITFRHLALLVYFIITAFAASFYWLFVVLCLYWLVFFKLQVRRSKVHCTR
jgi:hypothetical protein